MYTSYTRIIPYASLFDLETVTRWRIVLLTLHLNYSGFRRSRCDILAFCLCAVSLAVWRPTNYICHLLEKISPLVCDRWGKKMFLKILPDKSTEMKLWNKHPLGIWRTLFLQRITDIKSYQIKKFSRKYLCFINNPIFLSVADDNNCVSWALLGTCRPRYRRYGCRKSLLPSNQGSCGWETLPRWWQLRGERKAIRKFCQERRKSGQLFKIFHSHLTTWLAQ